MTIDVLQAAKYLAERSEWKLTRLEIQKMIYLAHMVLLGEKGISLVDGDFQAWNYGPVHPELYYFTKKVTSLVPPESLFGFVQNPNEADHADEIEVLRKVSDRFPPGSARDLIDITHWEGGAWAKCYTGEWELTRAVIPTKEIEREHAARLK